MNCQGIKADGTPCTYNAQPGSTSCGIHEGKGAIKRGSSREYVENRTPSHCDRVLVSPEMNKLEYTNIPSTDNGFVKYSDHDAVYAITSIHKLKILVATWNGGNIRVELPGDRPAIVHDWKAILTGIPVDVVFFSLQEMAPKDAKLFYQVIKELLPEFEWSVAHSTKGRMVAASAYTVSGLLGYRKGKGITFGKNTMRCLEQKSVAKTILCTKSVVAMSFRHEDQVYTMIGAHFPFKSKDTDTWGNDQRIRAMKETLRYVVERIDPHYVVLTGDLNFRKVPAGDQLDILLNVTQRLPIQLAKGEKMFAPTCKLRATDKPRSRGPSPSPSRSSPVPVQFGGVGSGLRTLRSLNIPKGPKNPKSPRRSKGKRTVKMLRNEEDKFYESLLEKSKKLDAPVPGPTSTDTVDIPESKYHRTSSNLPVNSPNQHSWYHHHAPFSQNFGDYVCIKRSALKDVGTFLSDTLSAN